MIRRSGVPSLIVLLLSACVYSLSSGSGFPSHVRTVAVIPFENETASPELTQELHDEIRKSLGSRLGLREASEARANAVVRGVITRFEADVPVGISADPSRATSARRKLQLVVDIQIVDQTTGKPLYERAGVSAEAEYAEREEGLGRKTAIKRLIDEVIEGAQSQW